MKNPIIIFLLLAILSLSGCSGGTESKHETLVKNGYDQTKMDAAITRAKDEIDSFLEVLAKGDADSFSVKAPITDANGTEHFWITDIQYEDGEFVGLIGNDPGIVQNVKFGDLWRVPKEDISDWMYVRKNRIYGGYTIDPLLDSFDPAQADVIRAQLVR